MALDFEFKGTDEYRWLILDIRQVAVRSARAGTPFGVLTIRWEELVKALGIEPEVMADTHKILVGLENAIKDLKENFSEPADGKAFIFVAGKVLSKDFTLIYRLDFESGVVAFQEIFV